jgi:predicted dehydrogenase
MKVLIIGLGSIAQKHISALRAIDDNVEIAALRSSGNAIETDGIRNVFSLDDVEDDIDFVIISNPTYLHGCTIRDILYLNKPLFIEKPLMHSVKEAEELSGIVRNSHVMTYVACNLRFHPVINHLKTFVQDKRINEVNVYCGSYLPEWRTGRDYRLIYSANPSKGGGVHLDLIHEIDYAYWLFGKPEKVSSTFSNASSLEIEAIDYANYCLSYKNFSVNIILNYYRRDSKREIEIVGEEATWRADLLNSELKELGSMKTIFSSEKRMIDTYHEQMNYFVNCISSGQKPTNNFFEALEVLKIALHEV